MKSIRNAMKKPSTKRPATARRVVVTRTQGPWLRPETAVSSSGMIEYYVAGKQWPAWLFKSCVMMTGAVTGLTVKQLRAAAASGAQIRFSAEVRTVRKGRR